MICVFHYCVSSYEYISSNINLQTVTFETEFPL